MNKNGHREIWNVGYSTTRPSIEVLSLAELRARAQPQRDQFLRPQRVDFDLLVVCDAGTLRHTVDFVEYILRPGDLLWVRAGQVQEWQWFDADAPHTPTGHQPRGRRRDRRAISAHPARRAGTRAQRIDSTAVSVGPSDRGRISRPPTSR